MPRDDRRSITALADGPRDDLQRRYGTVPALVAGRAAAASEGYDRYLKANRVERGVESYDAVVQLILGTGLDAGRDARVGLSGARCLQRGSADAGSS